MLTNRNPEYFLTVVAEGNISRAAEKLYISQPSLSQHIAKLEEALGVKLLDRSQTPLALTSAGELYRNYLENSAYLYQKFQADLAAVNNKREQTIHLGLGAWRGSFLFPAILPEFSALHPEAQIYLHEYPVNTLTRLVENGEVDFAVMNTAPGMVPDNLLLDTILQERLLLVMPAKNAVAKSFVRQRKKKEALDLSALSSLCHVTLSETLSVGRYVENFLKKNRLAFARQIRATNNTTVLNLVAAGTGFCFLVETGLADAKNRPDLVYFDLHSEDLSIPLSLCRKAGSFLSPLAEDLIRVLSAYCHKSVEDNQSLILQ